MNDTAEVSFVVRAAAVAGGILVVGALGLVGTQEAVRSSLSQIAEPRVTAAPALIEQQRTAAEHALQRGYLKSTGQLAEVHKLTLAIPAAQAASIDERARADLRQIRHDAFSAVGARLGMTAAILDAYVASTEIRLGDNALPDEPATLLAPDLYAIVARADDLFQRSADAATRALTSDPNATLSPSPTGR